MSAEMLSGGIQEFDEVVSRGDCPFLNSLGAAALEKMRAILQPPATQDSEQTISAETAADTAPVSKKITEKPADSKVVGLAEPSLVPVESARPEIEAVPYMSTKAEVAAIKLPESTWEPLGRDVQRALFERSEVMLRDAEPEPMEPRVQLDVPQVERVATVNIAPEPELPPHAVLAETNIEAVQVEQIETKDVKPTELALELLPINETEPYVPTPGEAGVLEVPITIADLLVEPLPDMRVELGVEAVTSETDTEPVPPFSVQLEKLVAETVEPERQETVEVLITQVYELVAQAGEDLEPGIVDLEQATDTPEMTAELEEAVTELLQELGVEEPSPEQIERFVALVRADQRRAAATEDEPVALPSTHDLSQSFTNIVSARYQAFMRLHQPLGRAALAQPIAA